LSLRRGRSQQTSGFCRHDAGTACADYQDQTLRDLECRRFQVDEIWSFVYAKKKTQTANPEAGDVWTWVAICNDSKLIPSWWIGDRSYDSGLPFMQDLASRVAHPIELTSDGLDAYIDAFEDGMVEHLILKRKYPRATTARTSYVERKNLTLRMSNRRYTRATNAFSKKLVNHAYSMSLHVMNYNFARPHQTLKGKTPAIVAGVTDHRWTRADIINRVVDPN
jgi:IS1 family transposase